MFSKGFSKIAKYSEGPESTFTHDGNEYSVDRALTATSHKKAKQVPVSSLGWILKHTRTSAERVQIADTKMPLLVAHWNGRLAVVDGAHRLKKALSTGQKTVPAKVLSQRDLEQSLVGGQGGTRTRTL